MQQQDIAANVIYVSKPHDLPETATQRVKAWAGRKSAGSGPLLVEASKLSLTIRQAGPDLPPQQALGIAQLRFNPVSERWTLWWCDHQDRWQLYDDAGITSQPSRLLTTIEHDRDSVFFG